jgi:hypothetical protein
MGQLRSPADLPDCRQMPASMRRSGSCEGQPSFASAGRLLILSPPLHLGSMPEGHCHGIGHGAHLGCTFDPNSRGMKRSPQSGRMGHAVDRRRGPQIANWNARRAACMPMLFAPTTGAAIAARHWSLSVRCPAGAVFASTFLPDALERLLCGLRA